MSTQPAAITIEPIVSYPREAEPGKTYLMTVDLRFPVGKEEWPYDEEEHELYCLLDSGPLFDNEELGESVIVLHRFGGTYGPAMFLLTANQLEMDEPVGAITLTLANRQLLPLQVFKLDKIRVSTKATTTSEIVTITRQQPVASGGIEVELGELSNETHASAGTDLPKADIASTEQIPISPPLILPPGIKLSHSISVPPPAKQIAWSQDGKTFAATSGNPEIRFWDVEGEPKSKPALITQFDVLGFDLSPDSLSFATWLSNNEVWIYRISLTGTPTKISSDVAITDVRWSPDSRWLALACQDGVIRMYDTRISRAGAELHQSDTFPQSIAWSPRGANYLIAGYENGLVIAWDTNSWSKRRNYRGHTSAANSVAISPSRVFIASGAADGTIRVWRIDTTDDDYQITLKGHTAAVRCVCFSHDGKLLASRSDDGTVRLWKSPAWECVAVIDVSAAISGQPPSPSSALAFHPKEALLATCLESDQAIRTLELDLRTLLDMSPQTEVERPQPARIFISHSGAEPNKQLVQQVTQALSEQHKVFTYLDVAPGEVWAERIEIEIHESDYLIVFLSAESVQSEMIAREVRQANELAQRQGGRPIILPVRVAYREPLPARLGFFLNQIQWAYWDTPSDTPRLIEQLKRAIASEELPAAAHPDNESRKRVFFAYKRDVEPDESTARQIAEAISERHDVFIDYQLQIGVDWEEAIKTAFSEAQVLIVLITAESMRSVPVRKYLELVIERSEIHGGLLKIIPVRLAYREPLPEDLADLDRIQPIVWQSPEDTTRVIDEIQRMLSNSTSQTEVPEPAKESEPSSRYLEIEVRSNQKTADNAISAYNIAVTGRAETNIATNDTLLIEGIIDRSIQSSSFDERFAEELTHYLLPDSIRSAVGESYNFILSLDKSSAQYPWEFLLRPTDDGPRPLAISGEMIRQLKNSRPATMPTYTTERNALVINDAYSRYPELRGAAEETRIAAGVLPSHGYDTLYFNRGDADEVVTRLHEREFQILHLSSRVKHDPNGIGMVGIAIGENFLLTANEISALKAVPELVFINFMHSGNVDFYARTAQGKLNQMAASLAEDWMAAGVKALVITGWTVDERAAVTFTSGYYEQFLNGHSFGEAVLSARRLTYEQHRRTNTWGAYQCYGDPEFRVSPPPGMPA